VGVADRYSGAQMFYVDSLQFFWPCMLDGVLYGFGMHFNLITNMNGVGLQADAEILGAELERRSHEVTVLQFDRPHSHRADVNIFLEVVVPPIFALAPKNYFVPNPEWFLGGWDVTRFDKVLTKTYDAAKIFSAKVNGRCRYLGWRSRDLYREDVKRERRFLHVAGKSQFKNTQAVVDGCALAGVPLTLVSDKLGRLPDEQLAEMFNSHQFFLCPSAAEGFGHVLHEALGCGAVVITTDAAPMNEIAPALLIQPSSSRPHQLAQLHAVTTEAVAEAVVAALSMSDAELSNWRLAARAAYERECAAFSAALDRELAC
jgi:Glycosyl transferases group 1